MLERVDANIVRLDKMEERYLQAAMIGEKGYGGEADEFADRPTKSSVKWTVSYPERARDIASFARDDFGRSTRHWRRPLRWR